MKLITQSSQHRYEKPCTWCVYTTEACAASECVFTTGGPVWTTGAFAALGFVHTCTWPGLHMAVSNVQHKGLRYILDVSILPVPVLPVCTCTCLHHRGLNCTWTCLNNRSLCWTGRVFTTGGLSFTWKCLHYRGLCCTRMCLHHKGLNCTCTCLNNKSLCCSWECLHHRSPSFIWTSLCCSWTCLHFRGLCCTYPCLPYHMGLS